MHGYWWPDWADANVIRYINHSRDLRTAYHYVKKFGAVVQAGGHCGVWPLALSGQFSHVYTFEPMVDNMECLIKNCEGQDNILAFNACLGAEPTRIAMRRNGKNTGGHKGTQEPGDTLVVTIDGLQLAECDLIVLDVEGMELPALQGARNTIESFSPVLMLEDRDHGSRHGWGGRESIRDFLAQLRYTLVARVAYDIIMVRK